jgi:hypothetical protein
LIVDTDSIGHEILLPPPSWRANKTGRHVVALVANSGFHWRYYWCCY